MPWRAGCPHREAAWTFVRERLAASLPDSLIVEATAPEGDWCKAAAVSPTVARLPAAVDLVVIHDADVWCDGLPAAIDAVRAGAAWAIPHIGVMRLTEAATARVLAGGVGDELCERAYRGVEGGGIVVLRRDTYTGCPLDPRFTGWGQEDISWGIALRCLHGEPWRARVPLTHLWHPPQQRMTRRYGSKAGRLLERRYYHARRDPVAMRALIEEATACSAASATS